VINDRAKVALSKRRVFALPLSTSPEFSKKLLEIKEIVYSEIDRRPKRSREGRLDKTSHDARILSNLYIYQNIIRCWIKWP
jgi:hypothetical protein